MSGKTVKEMLIELYKEEREQDRCVVVHELKKVATDTAQPYTKIIEDIEKERDKLGKQQENLRKTLNNAIQDRDTALKNVKLFKFTANTCGDALHDRLIDFDKTTKEHIREILEG